MSHGACSTPFLCSTADSSFSPSQFTPNDAQANFPSLRPIKGEQDDFASVVQVSQLRPARLCLYTLH